MKGLPDRAALSHLDKPTVIRIPGRDATDAVLVSALIHGTEPAGFRAMLHEINSPTRYAIDVYYLVGNVEAAKKAPYYSNRSVPGAQDFNRVWTRTPKTELEQTAAEIAAFLSTLPLRACLDIHSFTARHMGPHGIISGTDQKTIALARKLATKTFVSDAGLGTLIERVGQTMPSVILEVGPNNTNEADIYALRVLQVFFRACGVYPGELPDVCTRWYNKMMPVKVAPDVELIAEDRRGLRSSWLRLRHDIEQLNHVQLHPGMYLGKAASLDAFFTTDPRGRSIEDFLECRGGRILTRKAVVPSFLSKDEKIMKSCGFYFFEEFTP